MHFTKARNEIKQRVSIGGATIEPQPICRFLGIWLDRKLRWSGHLDQVREKLQTQQYALTRLAASTWGCSLTRAREIYTKVIRSVIAYGAAVFHISSAGGKTKGIARSLEAAQTKCLRVVTRAYKTTPTWHLETEAYIPPIGIYLDRRLAEFEARLEATEKAQLIRSVCNYIKNYLQRRRNRLRRRQRVDPESD